MKQTILPALAVLAVTALSSQAAVLARFDAGDTDPAQALQPGFTGIGVPNATNTSPNLVGPVRATDNGITLSLVNGLSKDASGDFNSTAAVVPRDRGAPGNVNDFTYGFLYRDFLTVSGTMGIQLSGLAANTSYSLIFYSYDNSGSRTTTFTDVTPDGTGNVGTVTYTSSFNFANSTNDVFSTTVSAITDADGRLFFSGTATGNLPVLNGLVVIPEPSSALLGGMLMLMCLRRRR